ncbi:MAG: glycosyltransferase family 2 protein [Bacteroidota bacterium]
MNATGDPQDPFVSVVVVNHNGRDVLLPCLESVYAQPHRNLEVILVDNASTDSSVASVREEFPGVRILSNRTNRGFAGPCNQGVEAARGEYVVLLNNDTVVTDSWIGGLLRTMADPHVGAAASRVVTDGVPARFYEMNGTLNYAGYNIMRHFADLSMVFFAGGASLMFRKSVVGLPFPEVFFLYQEDVFLSWRLRLRGYDIRMAQDSLVYHRGSVSAKRAFPPEVTFYQERNRLLNCLLLYEGKTLVRLSPYFLLDAAAKTVLSVLAGRKSLRGILRAYGSVSTHGGWILKERRALRRERIMGDRAVLRLMSSKVMEGESPLAATLNGASRLYARMVGLRRHD